MRASHGPRHPTTPITRVGFGATAKRAKHEAPRHSHFQLGGQFRSLVRTLCVCQRIQWSWLECRTFYSKWQPHHKLRLESEKCSSKNGKILFLRHRNRKMIGFTRQIRALCSVSPLPPLSRLAGYALAVRASKRLERASRRPVQTVKSRQSVQTISAND